MILFSLSVSSLFAAPELFESIAAIVDGKPIMRSEVMENLYQYQNSAEASGKSEKEQIAYVLDKLIDDTDSIRINLENLHLKYLYVANTSSLFRLPPITR